MEFFLSTPRLHLRPLRAADAPFLFELMNEPSFLRNIGERGIHTLADARRYLEETLVGHYAQHGFGLYAAERRGDGELLGLCGLVRREALEHVDVGFAFVPRAWGQGYATEAARACVEHAFRDVGLERLVAVVQPQNAPSIRVLERLGMEVEGQVRLDPGGPDLSLYATSTRTPEEGAGILVSSRFERADVAQAVALMQACVGVESITHEEIFDGRARALDAWSRDLEGVLERELAELAAAPDAERGCALVARRRDRILGLALLSFRPAETRSCVLEDIAVDRGARGEGIGGLLFDVAQRRARAAGCKHLFLEVGARNRNAAAFFEGLGCRDVARVLTKEL